METISTVNKVSSLRNCFSFTEGVFMGVVVALIALAALQPARSGHSCLAQRRAALPPTRKNRPSDEGPLRPTKLPVASPCRAGLGPSRLSPKPNAHRTHPSLNNPLIRAVQPLEKVGLEECPTVRTSLTPAGRTLHKSAPACPSQRGSTPTCRPRCSRSPDQRSARWARCGYWGSSSPPRSAQSNP